MPSSAKASSRSGSERRAASAASNSKGKVQLPPARAAIDGDSNHQEDNRGLGLLGQSRKGNQDTKKPSEVEDAVGDCRKIVCRLLDSMSFDLALSFIIALNAITIGIELSMQLEDRNVDGLRAVESCFLVAYIVELSLRFFGHGFVASMKTTQVQFDAVLVILGAVCTWVLEPIAGDSGTGTSADALGPVLILRMLRLLRLGRTIRMIRVFSRIHEFWLLVRGFASGMSIMMCTVVMFSLIIYVFSCMGVELITKHPLNDSDEEFRQHVQKHFSSLPMTMLTLARFAVLDNTSEVYVPLVTRDPWLFLYFGVILLVMSVIAFNLLSAVIFNTTLEQNVQESDAARKAQEDEWSQLLGDLKRMFLRLDQDGSGHLSREEVQNIHPTDMQQLTQALNIKTPMEVFHALDVDGSGELSITEFFDGTLDLLMNNTDKNIIHVKRMEKQVETMHWRLRDLFNTQHDLDLKLDKVIGGLDSLSFHQESSEIFGLQSRSSPGASFIGSSGILKDGTAQCVGEFEERLQKIWENSVSQTLKLTMQQLEETQTQLRQSVKLDARSMKAESRSGADDGSMSSRSRLIRENSSASSANGSVSSHSSTQSRGRSKNSRKRQTTRHRQDSTRIDTTRNLMISRSEESTGSTRTAHMIV
eukprot:TRINITY_DN23286_c0_g1_i1.p1 TRINITY_DN23286_c0_g1~~TRINITY_DN23286_c0_g1_i1.p1  ORF type:complete len:645 (+),score=93.89 TRINITY_DN23286_c0_g1_i1:122-2056(+)